MIKSLDRTGTWRTYSLNNGLAGLRVEHIAEDSEGYLWFATWDNGASRFDGDEFQNFTEQDGLIHDQISVLCPDRQGRLWFGTMNGVCYYDGTRFYHLKDEGIAGRVVMYIYEDRQGRTLVYWQQHPGVLRRCCFPRPDSALSPALRAPPFSAMEQPVPGHRPGFARPPVVWL